jgi:glycosyltransferase involved in cell wall biosynthesis
MSSIAANSPDLPDGPSTSSELMGDLTVIIPVRNAAGILETCLASVVRARPAEIVIVDGNSSDDTLDIARRYPVTVLSDEGKGLPYARALGARAAKTTRVALIDADVVLPEGALENLLQEFNDEGYVALQAGLASVAGPGYWGQALAYHHQTGRSKNWFGVVATIFMRDELLEQGFDAAFLSGEDIELRWRLQQAGAKIGVSSKTTVIHRFEDGFAFARGQWLADGQGLARMIRKHRVRAGLLAALPLAAGVRGIGLSLAKGKPKWIPYFLCFSVFNYVAMVGELVKRPRNQGAAAPVDG